MNQETGEFLYDGDGSETSFLKRYKKIMNELFETGYLPLGYLMMNSIGQIHKLCRLKNSQGEERVTRCNMVLD